MKSQSPFFKHVLPKKSGTLFLQHHQFLFSLSHPGLYDTGIYVGAVAGGDVKYNLPQI